MLLSIDHCHRNNILHRDVKLDNFLVEPSEHHDLKVKLADFGIACLFDKESPPSNQCGSVLTMAPEMLIGKVYCHKVDMWGLGVILYELLSTNIPFYDDDNEK